MLSSSVTFWMVVLLFAIVLVLASFDNWSAQEFYSLGICSMVHSSSSLRFPLVGLGIFTIEAP